MQSTNLLRRIALMSAAALAAACSSTEPTATATAQLLGEPSDPSAAVGDVQPSQVPYEWVTFCYKSTSTNAVARVQMNVDVGNNGSVDLTQTGTIDRGTCRRVYLNGGADDAVSFTLITVPRGFSSFSWIQNSGGVLTPTQMHRASSTSNVLVGGQNGAAVMLFID